jgi:hypothetical protein
MQSSGAITRKFGPCRKQSIGQTSTQSVYLQRMQESVTTKGMAGWMCAGQNRLGFSHNRRLRAGRRRRQVSVAAIKMLHDI